MHGVLEGIRVLDLSVFGAGPYCGTIIASMGAEVIRIERPQGSFDRSIGYLAKDGESFVYKSFNQNKKCITLDILTDEGREILESLIKRADVLLHNFVPGTQEASILEYNRLKEIKPDIIVAAVSAFGQDGPYAGLPGMDVVTQFISGATTLSGHDSTPGNPPTRCMAPYSDYGTGTIAAFGIMAALYHREKTGIGQMIDAALLDTSVCFIQGIGAVALYTVYGELKQRIGNKAFTSFGDCFRAKDGWVTIVTVGNTAWKRLLKLLDREDLIGDPRFESDIAREKNREVLEPTASRWVAERTVKQAIAELNKARITCAPANTIVDMLDDPQVKARELVAYVDHPGAGKIPLPRVPLKLSETPPVLDKTAAMVGEHNDEIYSSLLGLNQEQLSRLRGKGII